MECRIQYGIEAWIVPDPGVSVNAPELDGLSPVIPRYPERDVPEVRPQMTHTALMTGDCLGACPETALPGRCPVVIAIKRRVEGKSRLASVLPLQRRLTLVRRMLEHVIAECQRSELAGPVAVLSPERDTVSADTPVLADPGVDLNAALEQASATLRALGQREWLGLPADLPQVKALDIDTLIAAGRTTGCVLAGDAAGTGTNALYLRLDRPFRYQFGAGSLARHRVAAATAGLEARVLDLPRVAADVDTPEDLFHLDSSSWKEVSA
jgi:2-phospho-L-lactate/phosphoenolpyruvate guanylyltransferase